MQHYHIPTLLTVYWLFHVKPMWKKKKGRLATNIIILYKIPTVNWLHQRIPACCTLQTHILHILTSTVLFFQQKQRAYIDRYVVNITFTMRVFKTQLKPFYPCRHAVSMRLCSSLTRTCIPLPRLPEPWPEFLSDALGVGGYFIARSRRVGWSGANCVRMKPPPTQKEQDGGCQSHACGALDTILPLKLCEQT